MCIRAQSTTRQHDLAALAIAPTWRLVFQDVDARLWFIVLGKHEGTEVRGEWSRFSVISASKRIYNGKLSTSIWIRPPLPVFEAIISDAKASYKPRILHTQTQNDKQRNLDDTYSLPSPRRLHLSFCFALRTYDSGLLWPILQPGGGARKKQWWSYRDTRKVDLKCTCVFLCSLPVNLTILF